MIPKLGVYLLSYRRPAYIQEALNSLLLQDYSSLEIIISENSPDNSVTAILAEFTKNPKVKLIKRNPSLTSLAHFNTIISECTRYQYAMFFHDDDLLLANAISQMMKKIEADSNATAVACNAFIIKNTEKTKLVLSPGIKSDLIIKNQWQLILRSIFRKFGTAPFPSYIYRTEFLNQLNLDLNDGGKYSDTSFLVKLVARGPLLWLAQPLMFYRQHSQNDSADLNLKDIQKLCWFFIRTSPTTLPAVTYYFLKQTFKKFIYMNLRPR
jgi:glycosyltransferase involved in cell wall biosynthesis